MTLRRPLVSVAGVVSELPTLDSAAIEPPLASSRSGKDANNIYTIVEYRRSGGTLVRKSTLSGGTSPSYTTRTEVLYDTNGTTVLQTLVYTLTYTSGELTAETL